MEWRKADALLPETYSDILPKVDAVVHTLGTLLEDGSYKSALTHGDVVGLVAATARRGSNPLDRTAQTRNYQVINRDSGEDCYNRMLLQQMTCISTPSLRSVHFQRTC